ncbi:MAG: pyridoxamine 5'-phosphate oxidase family protein [Candidatus Bipolaricaulis sp.]|nr:pyridoxamine 5'-phosphate oxidase family protein [Candidatus Bipolaricaulis sp.]
MDDIVERILAGLRRDEFFVAALASVDSGGDPCVRYVRGTIDDDLTIRCPTFLDTNKVRQIQGHPRVALMCGDTESSRPGTYFEIKGEARISTDLGDRRRVWDTLQQKWFSGPDDPDFAVVVIRPTSIEALPIGGGPDAQIWRA